MKNTLRAFTLVELMIVATIMIMVGGIVYTFYLNVSRIYHRGSKTLLAIQDSQTILELISREIRSAAEIVELKPKSLVFQKYYDEPDPSLSDPTSDLNRIHLKTIHYRLVQEDDGAYRFERKVDLDPFEPFHPGFKSKDLIPDVFRGWRLEGNEYVIYKPLRWDPERIPLVEIRLDMRRDDQPFVLFKRVFLPAIFGKLPLLRIPESVEEQTTPKLSN
ncbi:hypothetical protein HOF92_15120 [bacterium]|jgi:hypothetical protein|nr:hypothetical protein [bacterium]